MAKKILILAEKPSLARNIARALDVPTPRSEYFENDKYFIIWFSGHLLKLYDCVDYDEKMKFWKLGNFPFVPDEFKFKEPEKTNDYIKKRISIAKKFITSKDVSEVWNACDPDREGELIATEILDYYNNKKPVKRLWLEDETTIWIKKDVKNLTDNSEMKNLQEAAYLRQQLDWLIGINFTSVATLILGGKGNVVNMGRVMTATMKLVYDRDMEIKGFGRKKYYQLETVFNTKNGEYKGLLLNNKHSNSDDEENDKKNKEEDSKFRFSDKKYLEGILEKIKKKNGIVQSIEKKEVKQAPPSLFSLTDLQAYMVSKYKSKGFPSVKRVLDVLQSLYEKKYVSYPRTQSRHLTEDQVGDAKTVMDKLRNNYPNCKFEFHKKKTVFDNSKVDSHSAIIPTYLIPSEANLDKEEKLLYSEICARFMSQFMPYAIYDKIDIQTEIDGHIFITSEKTLKSKGFLALFDKNEEDSNKVISALKENEEVKNKKTAILEKETKPPKHYTEATLIKAMENCGKKVPSQEDILKGFSIGTSSTRAETIEKLISYKYIKKEKDNLVINKKGEMLVEKLPFKELFNIQYTGKIEKALKDVEKGLVSGDNFKKSAIAFVKKGVESIKTAKKEEIG